MSRRRLGLDGEDLTYEIIGAFFEVYHTLGSGFLESVYIAALVEELRLRGLRVEREVSVRIYYKGKEIAWQRLDLLVEGKVIVEVKSTATLPITAMRQPQNYLQATRFEIGLLLHFGPVPKPYRFYAPNDRKHLPQVLTARTATEPDEAAQSQT